jgi:hypothetical protein
MLATPENAIHDGIYLGKVSAGSVLDLETGNRHYRIEYLGGEDIRISGHPELCPEPVLAKLKGSAYDSGGFEPGFIGRGMHLVFRRAGDPSAISTSKISEIRFVS